MKDGYIKGLKHIIKAQGLKDTKGKTMKPELVSIVLYTIDGLFYEPCFIVGETETTLTLLQVVGEKDYGVVVNKGIIKDVKVIYHDEEPNPALVKLHEEQKALVEGSNKSEKKVEGNMYG